MRSATPWGSAGTTSRSPFARSRRSGAPPPGDERRDHTIGRLFSRLRTLFRQTSPPSDDDLLVGLQAALSYHFVDAGTLQQALTHRSYLGDNGSRERSNERMEFLGDSVLELVVNEFLYRRFADSREGDLTKRRSLLVSRSILSSKAREFDLGRYLLLSAAEAGAGGRGRDSILADAYEAVVGAIYLDGGLEPARSFIEKTLLADADEILSDLAHLNFKSLLQEYVQGRSRSQPRYRVRSESGPDHQKTFFVEVAVQGKVLGAGEGRNKKEAEQQAARNALRALDKLPEG